jgi:hypothetical protein
MDAIDVRIEAGVGVEGLLPGGSIGERIVAR